MFSLNNSSYKKPISKFDLCIIKFIFFVVFIRNIYRIFFKKWYFITKNAYTAIRYWDIFLALFPIYHISRFYCYPFYFLSWTISVNIRIVTSFKMIAPIFKNLFKFFSVFTINYTITVTNIIHTYASSKILLMQKIHLFIID